MKLSFTCNILLFMPVVITARLSGKNDVNVDGRLLHPSDTDSDSDSAAIAARAPGSPEIVEIDGISTAAGDSIFLSANCQYNGDTALKTFKMAGIGGNYGNKAFNTVFSTGDRTGSIDRISHDAFNAKSPVELRASYDILLFTWATSTALNGDWATRIKPYIDLGGHVFWEDDRNIKKLSPEVDGVQHDGSYSSSYVITEQAAPNEMLTKDIAGVFSNHHLKLNSVDPSWTVYISSPADRGSYPLAIFKIFPSGGRMIVQGPDQDYHASRGNNQYNLILNQLDWLTRSKGTTISWYSPDNVLIGLGPSLEIINSEHKHEGTYTAICSQEDGLTDEAHVDIAFPNYSREPSATPSLAPSASLKPTSAPTGAPSSAPSFYPSGAPSSSPSAGPSTSPSDSPSSSPSASPSESPSESPSSAPSESPSFESISHEVCKNFAVHGGTTVTFDGVMSTIHRGDVGVSPGTSITGAFSFNNGGNATGLFDIDVGEIVPESADFAASILVAHDDAMADHGDAEETMVIEIGGMTFTPGIYRSGSAINFAHGTVVTLDGDNQPNPEFLFIAGSTLVTAADTHFNMINGAKAENVLWALGTAATLGARSVVEGSIMAGTAITFGTNSELHGCALAQSAVTFESEGSVVLNHYEADGIFNAISI